MGASESKSDPESESGYFTHKKLFDLTQGTRDVMDNILQYMLKEVTVKDFLALSNPNECKKYVLFMANALHNYFYELHIQPVKDRGGVIAFRSIRDLATPSEEDNREKQSLCLILAYYYTRIFQIYGALALTLIDDISTMKQTGIMSTDQKRRLVTHGHRPAIYGGALTANELGKFSFLRTFLRDEKEHYGYRANYQPQRGLDGDVFFSVKTATPSLSVSPNNPMAVPPSSSQKGVFTFAYGGAKHYSTIDIHVDRISSSSSTSSTSTSIYGAPQVSVTPLRISFSNFQYVKHGETSLRREEIPSTYLPKTLPLLYPTTLGDGQTAYTFREINKSLNEVLQDYFYRLLRFTKTLVEEKRILNTSDSQYVLTGKPDNTASKSGPSADVLKQLSASEDDTIPELRLGKIINNLQHTKPYGHCIARALQLLDNIPYRNQPGISHICKAKFLEKTVVSDKGITTRLSRSGIPEPGTDLSSSPGLLALSILFYDTIAIGTPKLEISQRPGPAGKSSLDQYVDFMKRMSKLFGDYYLSTNSKEARTDDSIRERGLAGIKNRRDKLFCEDYDGDIMISYQTSQKVYQVVEKLFKEQLDHAAKCGSIFLMLFDIQEDRSSGRKRISLNETILKKGVDEINRINYLARDQLVKYYSNCEVTYMEGMKIVIDSKRREKAEVDAISKPPTIPAPTAPPAPPVPSRPAPTAPSRPAPPALATAPPGYQAPVKKSAFKAFDNVGTFLKSVPTPASKASVAEARARGLIPPQSVVIPPKPASKASVSEARAKGLIPPSSTPAKKSVRFLS